MSDERMKFLKKESSDASVVPSGYKSGVKKSTKLPQIAAALQQLIPDAPETLLSMLNTYHCDLCQKFIPSLKPAILHFNGDKHQINLLKLGMERREFLLEENQIQDIESGVLIYAETANVVQIIDPISKAKTEEIKVLEKLSELDMEYCTVCSVPFTSSINALKHYGGKKHKKNCFQKMTTNRPIDALDEFRCKICNVMTSTAENLQLHLDGKPHQKRLEKVIEENNMRNNPPDQVARMGVMDYNAGPDDSFQPYGIPAPLFTIKSQKSDAATPHLRLNDWWHRNTGDTIGMKNLEERSTRINKDRFLNMSEMALRDYLHSVYK